jgi:hypothetical protein
MNRTRTPPKDPHTDHLANECGITVVSFKQPIADNVWCHYCGYLANTRDHIVPDSVGGQSAWWNLVPSCRECNESKGDRQACPCLFCLRAIALWHLGFRRSGAARGEKDRRRRERRRQERELAS